MLKVEEENETPLASPLIRGENSGKQSPQEGEKNGPPKKTLNKGELVSIAFQLGFIIALPVVLFGLLGKWLDARTDTYPLLTLIGILTAIVFTTIWMYRKFKAYFDNLKK